MPRCFNIWFWIWLSISQHWLVIPFGAQLQNLVSVITVSILSLSGVISTEPLTWRLVKVWLPVNFIFVGMLITSMFRYDFFILTFSCIFWFYWKKKNPSLWWASLLHFYAGKNNPWVFCLYRTIYFILCLYPFLFIMCFWYIISWNEIASFTNILNSWLKS